MASTSPKLDRDAYLEIRRSFDRQEVFDPTNP
jgi:hypothetical protein